MALIDGDDSLIGRKVLNLYNAVYQINDAVMIYSNFLKVLHNNQTSYGFGTDLTRKYFWKNELRTEMMLIGSHLMTFYSDIFKMIKKEDLCYENGTYYEYAYDRAIITPIAEMAFPHVYYLP